MIEKLKTKIRFLEEELIDLQEAHKQEKIDELCSDMVQFLYNDYTEEEIYTFLNEYRKGNWEL